MKLSNFNSRFLIALISLGIGLAVLLFSRYSHLSQGWVERFDSACVRTIFSSESRSSDYDPASKTITIHTLGHHPEKSRPFREIHITDDPDRIFESSPPSPLDYAIILEKLLEQGYRHVVIGTRMTWDQPANTSVDALDTPELSTQALNFKLAQFDHSVIGLPVTRGASSQPLPAPLRRSLIQFDQVKGNSQLIPVVNQVSLPASITGGDNTLAGFSQIESAPASKGSTPLLANWENEGIIPSVELLGIMSAHDISSEELEITAGKRIRLGQSGPVIKIDSYGQTSTPTPTNPISTPQTTSAIEAENLISQKPATQEVPVKRALCLVSAIGTSSSSINLLSPDRISTLPALCRDLPTPGDAVLFQKLPLVYELLILLVVALLMGRLSTLSSYNRHLAFALATPLLVILLLILMETNQQWFGLAAPALAIGSAWLISGQLKKSK